MFPALVVAVSVAAGGAGACRSADTSEDLDGAAALDGGDGGAATSRWTAVSEVSQCAAAAAPTTATPNSGRIFPERMLYARLGRSRAAVRVARVRRRRVRDPERVEHLPDRQPRPRLRIGGEMPHRLVHERQEYRRRRQVRPRHVQGRAPHQDAATADAPLDHGRIEAVEPGEDLREILITREILAQEALRRKLDKDPTYVAQMDVMKQQILLGVLFEDFVKKNEPAEAAMRKEYDRVKAETESTVATLRHMGLRLQGPLERGLLKLLDGTRDRAALLDSLAGLLESGEVTWDQVGAPAEDPHERRRGLEEGLERNLVRLGTLALLVA